MTTEPEVKEEFCAWCGATIEYESEEDLTYAETDDERVVVCDNGSCGEQWEDSLREDGE